MCHKIKRKYYDQISKFTVEILGHYLCIVLDFTIITKF